MNNPCMKSLPIGSSHGHGTAEAVAKLHGILANGGMDGDKKLISEKYVSMLAEPKVWGVDVSGGLDHMWSLGPLVLPVVEGHKAVSLLSMVYVTGSMRIYSEITLMYFVFGSFFPNVLSFGKELHETL